MLRAYDFNAISSLLSFYFRFVAEINVFAGGKSDSMLQFWLD